MKGDNMGTIIGLDIGIASVGVAVVDKDTLEIKCVVFVNHSYSHRSPYTKTAAHKCGCSLLKY